MVLALTLLPALLVALCVVAAGPVLIEKSGISLPVSRRFNFTGTSSVVQSDMARIRAIKAYSPAEKGFAPRAAISVPVDNQIVTYIASVGVGSPATTYSLIVDTGSSNTWVGAGKAYVETSTSIPSAEIVSVSYGSGSFFGTEWTDKVTLASGLVISKQSIGVADFSQGFNGVDGILGQEIGPVALTAGTLLEASTATIPTVTDNLFSQRTIPSDLIGVSFNPTNKTENVNGWLAFGSTDSTKFTGSVAYTPVTSTAPATNYWGIDQSVAYGTTRILASTAGIVDTGTTLVYLATDAFNKYKSATGAVPDQATGLLRITAPQFATLQPLHFLIGGATYTLTPNAQIWPRALNTAIGGTVGSIYLVVADLGSNSGGGLDFINGYAFLERFYSVFDTGKKRVGFATTPFTTATTN